MFFLYNLCYFKHIWRGARAVDWASLLRKCAFTGTEGSNPSLSAANEVSEEEEHVNFFACVRGEKATVMFLFCEAKAKTTRRGDEILASAKIFVTESLPLRRF